MGKTGLFSENFYPIRRWLCIALFCLTNSTSMLYGQYFDPFCQNIASGSKSTHDLTLDWNLGEALCTETITSKSTIILSTGFLQNQNEAIITFKRTDSFNLKVIIGPNPIEQFFTISCAQDGLDILHIKIIDAFGNSVQEIKGPYSGLNFQKKINMLSENKGLYYVIVNYLIAGQLGAYKVFKLVKI